MKAESFSETGLLTNKEIESLREFLDFMIQGILIRHADEKLEDAMFAISELKQKLYGVQFQPFIESDGKSIRYNILF